MAYCEDFPACGHTPADPCARQWYDEPDAFDLSVNPHAFCDHEDGICEAEYIDDEPDPETCEHEDLSFTIDWRGEELWLIDRECDICGSALPDVHETDPYAMELWR